jgi:hypothetical protein
MTDRKHKISLATLRSGIVSLSAMEVVFSGHCEKHASSKSLLVLRDVRGLLARLEDADPKDWNGGAMQRRISPVDLRFLEELALSAPDSGVSASLLQLATELGAYLGFAEIKEK